MTSSARSVPRRGLAWPVVALAGASLLLAACSSSSKSSSTPSAGSAPAAASAGSATSADGSSASSASVRVSAAGVPGVGTVLVDGNGRTLYVLASEKGGRVTCSAAGGCTTVWPPLVLPPGTSRAVAGSGVQASLLGTVTGPAGEVRVTYGGWPLYTFTADSGSGTAKGQNVKDAFGLWLALTPSGSPAGAAASTAATAPSAPTTAAPQSGGAGF